jgi:hypothetical protein
MRPSAMLRGFSYAVAILVSLLCLYPFFGCW